MNQTNFFHIFLRFNHFFTSIIEMTSVIRETIRRGKKNFTLFCIVFQLRYLCRILEMKEMETEEKSQLTYESVLALIKGLALSSAESSARFDREMAESRAEFDRSKAEFDRRTAEYNEQRAETDRQRAETDRMIKNLRDMVGGVANSNGSFAETYFFNTIDKGDKALFGEHFDECFSAVKHHNKANKGIAILKQVGDLVVLNDENLHTF